MHELAAKYLTDGGRSPGNVLRRLQERLTGAGYRIEARGRRSFTDRYFDTADQRLRAAGWSYRERQDERGRHAALKEITRSRSAIFDRQQIEQPIDSEQTLTTLGSGPVRDRLSNLLPPDAEVIALFSIANERSAYALSHPAHPRALVEMGFDQCRIEAHDPLEFHELALELKSGPHELLAEVLTAVELEPSLIEARLSAFERGLLASGCPLERRRGVGPKPPSHGARWLDLALLQLSAELHRVRLYEPYAWESLHPHGVQHMLAAVQRTRSALRMFVDVLPLEPAGEAARGLRWVDALLTRAHDLDRQARRLAGYAQGADAAHRALLDRYRAHLERLHQAAQRKLRDALAAPAHADLSVTCQRLLANAARAERAAQVRIDEMAAPAILPLLGRVQRRARQLREQPVDSALRRLPRDLRRLAHCLEFLAPVYGRSLEAPLARLQALNDRMRRYQDARDAHTQLEHYRQVHATQPLLRSQLAHLMRLEARRAQRHWQRLQEAWQRFEGVAGESPEWFRGGD